MGIALHQPSVEKIKNQITSMISRFRPGGSSAIPPSPSAPMDWKKKVAAWDSNTMAAKLRARSKKMSDGGFSFYGKVLTILLCSYFLADGLALWMAASIPAPPPTAAILDSYLGGASSTEDYNAIVARNLFNSQGLIPGEKATGGMDDSPPIRTSLQLNLLGTVILSNPARSLATLEDKSANMVYPLRANDELPGKLKVLKVEARRMIFFNLANYRKEFVEMPEETGASTKISRVTLTTPSASAAPPSDDKIKQVSETQFTVEGSALDQALANLPLVLTQAKAVPNFENGVPAGFRLTQIVPGSIYTQLGIKDDDILYGFDGERINDAGRAMDALNNLKTAKTLSVQLKRKDHRLNLDYTINR